MKFELTGIQAIIIGNALGYYAIDQQKKYLEAVERGDIKQAQLYYFEYINAHSMFKELLSFYKDNRES